ncbi:MAG TPA: TRAP transporter large permease [Azospirillaceae bacterium]|nr:TRAP transporter large permease [Azospirillaceae bacterium]
MELTLLLLSMAALLTMGVPVAFAMLGATLLTLFVLDIPPVVAFQQMAAGMNIFSLIAIPFFVFTGNLMHRAGIARRIVAVVDAALGRIRGGMGVVDVGASMMFGAISGSAIATVSAMGSTLMPMMKEKGYDADYAVNVTSSAAIIGVMVPPSHNMIIYAAAAGVGVSVNDMFLAGIVPGILTGLLLMVTAWAVAVKRGYPAGTFPGFRALFYAFIMALPGLVTALIIFVGVLGGLFTATESSAVAVIYTMLVAGLVYRSMSWRDFASAAIAAVQTTAMVMLIIGTAGAFGWLVALLEAPAQLAGMISAISENPLVIYLIINIILLVLGTFMDMAPLIVICTPIFLPVVQSIGGDPVHFGIIMMLNQGIGLVTPPVGSVQFVGAAIGKITVEQSMKTIWPFYGALALALILITYIPALSLTLPALVR